ncbi:hypothetical protein Tco_0241171 [Tanacetum coccineum]
MVRSSDSLNCLLGVPFLRTARALIDVYGEELTLRVSDEAITFKVGNTSRYSYNDAESINRIDVIDIACEEYSQEVLGFSDNSESGNPTPTSEPIIAKSSPSLTSFEGDPPGGPHGATTPLKKSFDSSFNGRSSIYRDAHDLVATRVTLVDVKAKSRNVMKCLKMQFQVASIFDIWGFDL